MYVKSIFVCTYILRTYADKFAWPVLPTAATYIRIQHLLYKGEALCTYNTITEEVVVPKRVFGLCRRVRLQPLYSSERYS